MNAEFNRWWNVDLLTEDNPFVDGTPAYWAWEGWCAGVKAEREKWEGQTAVEIHEAVLDEREACAKLCDDLDDDIVDGLAGWQYGEAIRARGNT